MKEPPPRQQQSLSVWGSQGDRAGHWPALAQRQRTKAKMPRWQGTGRAFLLAPMLPAVSHATASRSQWTSLARTAPRTSALAVDSVAGIDDCDCSMDDWRGSIPPQSLVRRHVGDFALSFYTADCDYDCSQPWSQPLYDSYDAGTDDTYAYCALRPPSQYDCCSYDDAGRCDVGTYDHWPQQWQLSYAPIVAGASGTTYCSTAAPSWCDGYYYGRDHAEVRGSWARHAAEQVHDWHWMCDGREQVDRKEEPLPARSAPRRVSQQALSRQRPGLVGRGGGDWPAPPNTQTQDSPGWSPLGSSSAAHGSQPSRSRRHRDLRVHTINVNSWGRWRDVMLDVESDIVCIQEHRLPAKAVDPFRHKLTALGWSSAVFPALPTAAGSTSGGVAICWRQHLDAAGPPAELLPGRAMLQTFKSATAGLVDIVALYGKVDDPPLATDTVNGKLLMKVQAALVAGGHNFIVAGDFNHAPQEVQEFWRAAGVGTVAAPSQPTCISDSTASVIDFFIVDDVLANLVTAPVVDPEVVLAPHRAVALTVSAAQADTVVTYLVRPSPAAANPVIGPHLLLSAAPWRKWREDHGEVFRHVESMTDWSPGLDDRHSALLDVAFADWSRLAHAELAPQVGMEHVPGQPFDTKQDTLANLLNRKTRQQGTPELLWKWATTTLKEIMALVKQAEGGNLRAREQIHSIRMAVGQDRALGRLFKHSLTDAFIVHQLVLSVVRMIDWPRARSCGIAALPHIIALAERGFVKACKEARTMRVTAWARFREEALANGAGIAHRLTRLQEPVAQRLILNHDGSFTSCPLALFAEQHALWQKYWRADDQPQPREQQTWRHVFGPIEPLPKLREQELADAARSFKVFTSNVDGWHPRHVAILSPEAREALADVFYAQEAQGDVVTPQRSLQARLLKKPDGGRRPIGLFRGLFRVWSRARRWMTRRWQVRHAGDAVLNMAPHRHVGDGTWRSLARNALTREDRAHSIEAQWDVTKCFENVGHEALIRLAVALQFPSAILRLSVASYRWSRSLIWDASIVMTELYATRGIVAGSGFATYELSAYTVVELRVIQAAAPGLTLSVHVDDVTLCATAKTKQETVLAFSKGAAALVQGFEHELELPFSKPKAFLLATDEDLGNKAAHLLKDRAGQHTRVVRRLGYDYALRGSTRRGAVKKLRVKRFIQRVPLIRRMATKQTSSGKLFYTGLLPAVAFGAEAVPYSPQEATIVRTAAAKLTRRHIQGAPPELIWLGAPPAQDPLLRIREQALMRWHREWWLTTSAAPPEDVLTPVELRKLFQQAAAEFDPSLPFSKRRCDPCSLALYSAAAVGWSFSETNIIEDADGQSLHLAHGSPALLRWLYRKAHQQAQAKEAVHSHAARHPDATDSQEWRAVLSQGLWFLPYQRLMCTTAADKPTPDMRLAMRRLFTGASHPLVRLSRWRGENFPCPWCDCAAADDQHWAWHCPAWHDVRASVVEEDLLLQAQAAPRGHPLFSRGWAPQPAGADRGSLPQEDVRYIAANHEVEAQHFVGFDPKDGPLFTDGSCLHPSDPHYARAGSAVVQVNVRDGRTVKAVEAPLPDFMPQTAAFAEHYALLLAATHSLESPQGRKPHAVTDCQSVLVAHAHPAAAVSYAKTAAGLWRELPTQRLEQVVKTKAHRSRVEAEHDNDVEFWRGNVAADRHAKAAAARYDVEAAVFEAHEERFALVKNVLKSAAAILAPVHAKLDAVLDAQKAADKADRQAGSLSTHESVSAMAFNKCFKHHLKRKQIPRRSHALHQLHWHAQHARWSCARCRRTARAPVRLLRTPCTAPRSFKALLEAIAPEGRSRGHVLHTAHVAGAPQESLIFCARCGGYAQRKAFLLLKPCPGHSRVRTRPFRNRRHPERRKVGLAGFRRLGLDGAGWWDGGCKTGGWHLALGGHAVGVAGSGQAILGEAAAAAAPQPQPGEIQTAQLAHPVPDRVAVNRPVSSALDDADAELWEADEAEAGTGHFQPDVLSPASFHGAVPGPFQAPPDMPGPAWD